MSKLVFLCRPGRHVQLWEVHEDYASVKFKECERIAERTVFGGEHLLELPCYKIATVMSGHDHGRNQDQERRVQGWYQRRVYFGWF